MPINFPCPFKTPDSTKFIVVVLSFILKIYTLVFSLFSLFTKAFVPEKHDLESKDLRTFTTMGKHDNQSKYLWPIIFFSNTTLKHLLQDNKSV